MRSDLAERLRRVEALAERVAFRRRRLVDVERELEAEIAAAVAEGATHEHLDAQLRKHGVQDVTEVLR